MTTLFDATLALAKVLGNVRTSVTTAAGSATSIVDSTRTEPADYWNDGTLWITSGTHAGKSRKVTDWALTTTTFTIPTTTSAAGSGASYAVITNEWPQDKLIEFVNAVLSEYGDVGQSSTSLTTVADQERYALPAGVANVKRVEIATGTVAPLYYVPWYCWTEPGDGYLYFETGREPSDAGYTIRLWYESAHAVLTADTGTVSAYVNAGRLTWEAAVKAWEWRQQMSGRDKPEYRERLAYAAAKAAEMRGRYPTLHMPKAPRLTL